MSNIKTALPGKPVERNIVVTRDDTFIYPIRGFTEDGKPYDFTNHTFRMQVRVSRKEGAEVILDIPDSAFNTSQDSLGQNNNAYNILTIKYDASNMDIDPGDYVYDIEMTTETGEVQTFQKEKDYFRVEQDVTQ